MCHEDYIISTLCGHKTVKITECDFKRQSEDGGCTACFGSGECHMTRLSHKTSFCSADCKHQRHKQEDREARARGAAAASKYGWADQRLGDRDSYLDPSIAKAAVVMPGSQFAEVYDPCRAAARVQRPPRLQQPPYYQQARTWPERVNTGTARVRQLPSLNVQHVNNAQKPQIVRASYLTMQPMRAGAPQAKKSVRVQVSHVHEPQMVDQRPSDPKRQTTRRNSDGVSELGSDEGDVPGWRTRAVSPTYQWSR